MKKKLLVILPKYDSSSPDHLTHLLEMIDIWNKNYEVALLFENIIVPDNLLSIKKLYYPQKVNPYISILRRVIKIIELRVRGYKDCYVYYSYFGALFSSLIFRPTGGKVYYWHCELFNNFYSKEENLLETVKKWLSDKLFLILTLHSVNLLITGSNIIADSYSRIFRLRRNKILIAPNWINVGRFNNKISKVKNTKKTVLFVHKLVPRKGADFLPEIISKTVSQNKNVRFTIIGDGKLLNTLKKTINRMKLEKYVNFLGAIGNDLIPSYYHQSDLFIMPSRQEGFPRVLLEAMAAGLPFVATDVGGVRDVLLPIHQRFLIKSESMDDFSAEILRILGNRRLHTKMQRIGLKHVKNYEINKVAKIYKDKIFK